MLNIKRAREVVVLCTDMALKAEHSRALARLRDVEREVQRDPREVDTRLRDAAQAVQDVEQKMRDHELEFVLEALTRKAWVEFLEANPPRPGEDADKALALNVAALDEPIAASIREVRGRADGELVEFDPADWPTLADEISNAQWEDFAQAVLRLNNSERNVPFSPAASNVMRRSEQSLKQPSDFRSPTSGSKGGSRSRRTSTTRKGA